MDQKALKLGVQASTQTAYSFQEERIRIANQITSNYRQKTGKGTVPIREPIYGVEEDPTSMELLKTAFEKHTQKGKNFPTKEQFKANGVITSYEELLQIQSYLKMVEEEADTFLCIEPLLEAFPIYNNYLSKEKYIPLGVCGLLLGWFDIHIAKVPSSFWSYSGLTPPKTPVGPQKVASLQAIPDIGNPVHNAFIKIKLLTGLAPTITKDGCPWKKSYEEYRHRLECDPTNTRTPTHLHNMAVRYAIKAFLVEFHKQWRVLEGYPEPTPFRPREK